MLDDSPDTVASSGRGREVRRDGVGAGAGGTGREAA